MAEALKNMYSEAFVHRLANDLATRAGVNAKEFKALVMDSDWEERALKARSNHIAFCMDALVPGDYINKVDVLKEVALSYSGYSAVIFSDFVELFGLNHWEKSMEAMEVFTQRCTAEFAVRPFFQKDFQRMVEQHLVWSQHQNEHIRRLSSEGIRPRLPWGAGIPILKKDPSPIFPILENLMMDDSEYVRRSVANNLNDISKDHPHTVLDFVKHRNLQHRNTSRLVKHALRGLLKKGHPEALSLFGFGEGITLSNASVGVEQKEVEKGGDLFWNYSLEVSGAGKLRLEYHVYYQKANGSLSPKVFQLSEQQIEGTIKVTQKRKLSLADLTTRKHHPGLHEIHLVANGQDIAQASFILKA